MLDSYIEKEIFRKTFQRLTFTPCIKIYDLCDLAYIEDYLDENGIEPDKGVAGNDYVRYEKKYKRILQRLCINAESELTSVELLAEPKIYDEFMRECQKKLYNQPSKKIGYMPVKHMMPTSLLKEAAFLDGALPDYDVIVKHYPYYPCEKQDGVNFIEFILLLNIYFTIHGRSLFSLSKKPTTSKDERLTKKMVEDLVDSMKDVQMYYMYVNMFFGILYEALCPVQNEKAEKAIRLGYLPERLKNRVDAFTGLETYVKKYRKNAQEYYSEEQAYINVLWENLDDSVESHNALSDSNDVDFMAYRLLPMAFHILMNSDEQEYVSDMPALNKLAKEYAKIIEKFIKKAVDETENILRKLYT